MMQQATFAGWDFDGVWYIDEDRTYPLLRALLSSQGLAAHWTLDEGEGDTAYDSAGNNDGAVYGAQWTAGISGGALEFDGVDNYVGLIEDDLPSSGPYSVSLWLYAVGDDQGQQYVKGGHDQNACWIHYHINENARFTLGSKDRGSGRTVMKDADNNNYEISRAVNDGWTHLAVVFDSNGNFERVYMNGIEAENKYNTASGWTDTGWDFSGTDSTIGRLGSSGTYFNGKLDDIRIYERALSRDEIQVLC